MNVKTVRALKDNYCYLLVSKDGTEAAVIDPSEAAPIETALEKHHLKLTLILNTHHHHDHVGGNLELKDRWHCPIYCSQKDFARIPGATKAFQDGDVFQFGGHAISVLEIPGHTQGQIAFHADDALFVGDTVFEMGCGRLFEGTAEQMFRSLNKIQRLPRMTRIYFGHEYTETNARFALEVEPTNKTAIGDRLAQVRADLSRDGFASAPALETESAVNPFFRAETVEAFTALRERRNTFQ